MIHPINHHSMKPSRHAGGSDMSLTAAGHLKDSVGVLLHPRTHVEEESADLLVIE